MVLTQTDREDHNQTKGSHKTGQGTGPRAADAGPAQRQPSDWRRRLLSPPIRSRVEASSVVACLAARLLEQERPYLFMKKLHQSIINVIDLLFGRY